MATLTDLAELVEGGKGQEVRALTQKLLGENVSADAIITEGVIAGLDALGKKFEKFEAFVPELITAGLAAQEALKGVHPRSLPKVWQTFIDDTLGEHTW